MTLPPDPNIPQGGMVVPDPPCTCPLRIVHLGTRLYPGLVLLHVDGCGWAAWYETQDPEAAALAAQRRAASEGGG